MTKDELKTLLRTYMYDEDVTIVMSAVEAYSSASNNGKPITIGSADILLLTDEVKSEVKRLWQLPSDYNSSPKVAAVKLIMKIGKDTGVEIGIKRAKEVIEQHCL